MKSIVNAMIIVMVTGLSSCISENVGPAGPVGPQGNDGPIGQKGDSGFVFEYDQINFTAPDYEVFLPFPDDFESLSSDVALVYLLWDVVKVDGVDTEVWRQIPQTILTNEGILQYNFDFSLADVRLFMDADFDLALLGALDTDDWIARVVIVPGDFWSSARLMPGEIQYNDLKEMLGLPELAVPNSVIQRRQ
ncbi:MAG: collagen-like protein [Cyclobacteriaceae bacterium]|nr:collagen-like protein [Cyclobacteriaceae bacterium]